MEFKKKAHVYFEEDMYGGAGNLPNDIA